MSARCAVIVAYGSKAVSAAGRCYRSLARWMPDLPVCVIGDGPVLAGTPVRTLRHPDLDRGGRLAKLSLLELTRDQMDATFDHLLYLDADTIVQGDLSAGFRLLDDGWEMALAPSGRQGDDLLGNCQPEDRAVTIARYGMPALLGLQCGVMFVRRCPATTRLFEAWREEWARFRSMDQAAFLRAYARVPVRLWLLGRPWNSAGGALVDHRFGQAARKGRAA